MYRPSIRVIVRLIYNCSLRTFKSDDGTITRFFGGFFGFSSQKKGQKISIDFLYEQ
jgi:hypothetical protein